MDKNAMKNPDEPFFDETKLPRIQAQQPTRLFGSASRI